MTDRTPEAGRFNEILHDIGIVEVVESEEDQDEEHVRFLVTLRLRKDRREVDFVERIVKPLYRVQGTYPDYCMFHCQKSWVLTHTDRGQEVLFGYSVEAVVAKAAMDLLDVFERSIADAEPKVEDNNPLRRGSPVPPPKASGNLPPIAARPPVTDVSRARTILDLPDEVITRPLAGVFSEDRNRPKMIPSKYPALSGQEFVAGAGVSGNISAKR